MYQRASVCMSELVQNYASHVLETKSPFHERVVVSSRFKQIYSLIFLFEFKSYCME